MPLSGFEERRWRELEAQLARDRRLVALSRRLTVASSGGGIPRSACLVWAVGGCLGLTALILGGALHSAVLSTVGVALSSGTLLLVGILLIAAGLRGCRLGARARPSAGAPGAPSGGH